MAFKYYNFQLRTKSSLTVFSDWSTCIEFHPRSRNSQLLGALARGSLDPGVGHLGECTCTGPPENWSPNHRSQCHPDPSCVMTRLRSQDGMLSHCVWLREFMSGNTRKSNGGVVGAFMPYHQYCRFCLDAAVLHGCVEYTLNFYCSILYLLFFTRFHWSKNVLMKIMHLILLHAPLLTLDNKRIPCHRDPSNHPIIPLISRLWP